MAVRVFSIFLPAAAASLLGSMPQVSKSPQLLKSILTQQRRTAAIFIAGIRATAKRATSRRFRRKRSQQIWISVLSAPRSTCLSAAPRARHSPASADRSCARSTRIRRPSNTTLARRLYLEYLRYVDAFQPLAILMENVPDVLNHGGQNIAEEICEVLETKGYVARYTLLNAAFYGVPQMRERMFLIGYRRDSNVR